MPCLDAQKLNAKAVTMTRSRVLLTIQMWMQKSLPQVGYPMAATYFVHLTQSKGHLLFTLGRKILLF